MGEGKRREEVEREIVNSFDYHLVCACASQYILS